MPAVWNVTEKPAPVLHNGNATPPPPPPEPHCTATDSHTHDPLTEPNEVSRQVIDDSENELGVHKHKKSDRCAHDNAMVQGLPAAEGADSDDDVPGRACCCHSPAPRTGSCQWTDDTAHTPRHTNSTSATITMNLKPSAATVQVHGDHDRHPTTRATTVTGRTRSRSRTSRLLLEDASALEPHDGWDLPAAYEQPPPPPTASDCKHCGTTHTPLSRVALRPSQTKAVAATVTRLSS